MKFRLNPQKWTPVSVAWGEGVKPSNVCEELLRDLEAAHRILERSSNDWDQAGSRWISERISKIRNQKGTDLELVLNPELIEEVYTLVCLDEELDRIESKSAWVLCESIRDRAKRSLLVEKGL